MSEQNSEQYFEALCEQEQALQDNHVHLKSVLNILGNVVDEEASDEDIVTSLGKLSKTVKVLVDSSVDLRYKKFRVTDVRFAPQAAEQSRFGGNSNDHLRQIQKSGRLREYVSVLEAIYNDSLTYINLLTKLSVNLAKQIEFADHSVSEFLLEDWKPPHELQSILEKFVDMEEDPEVLNDQLNKYMDNIKMERAKYSLENKYSLQEQLKTLESELSRWRDAWVNIESLMFGDSPNSMKGMLQNIESMKKELSPTAEN